MKNRSAAYRGRIWLASTIVFTASLLSASARPGRAVQAPGSATALQPVRANRSDFKPALVPGVRAGQYKLVFPTGREGDRRWKNVEVGRGRTSLISSFVEQLNKAGAQGYRVLSATGHYPVALVELGDVKYEYDWFEAVNNRGFEDKYAELSKRGFRLAEEFYWGESQHTEPVYNQLIIETTRYFLLEREKGVEKPAQDVFIPVPWSGTCAAPECLKELNEKLAGGFYPSKIFDADATIRLEKAEGDKLPPDKLEVQVVSSLSGWRDDRKLRKKINVLAQQGYRLALVNKQVAVMYRRRGNVTPVSYVWVNATKRDFEAQLSKIQESGAVYRATYPNERQEETQLIFEQGAAGGGRRREYKVLRFDFEEVEDSAAKRVNIDLTKPSKETLKTLDNLAQEGFAVCDVFLSDKFSVLLERSL